MKFFSTFSQKYLEVIKKAVSLQRFREIEHIKLNEQMKGRLAQLVQSICLTSRGSAVRIRQRPRQKGSLTKKFVRLFLFLTSFIQTFFLLLSYNSGKRVNFAV